MKLVAVITQDDGEGQLIERYRRLKYDMNLQPSWIDQEEVEPTTQLGTNEEDEEDKLVLRARITASIILANAYPAAPAGRLGPKTSWTDHLYMERTKNELYVDKSVKTDEYAGKPIWPIRNNPSDPSDDQNTTPTKDYKIGTRGAR